MPVPTLSRGFHKRFIFLWSSLSAMFTDTFLVQQRLGHKKVSTTPGTHARLYPDRTVNVADRLEGLAFPVEKEPRYWFDSASGVTLDAKKPRLQAKNLEGWAFFIRCSVLFLSDSKSRKANFYYSSSVSSDCH